MCFAVALVCVVLLTMYLCILFVLMVNIYIITMETFYTVCILLFNALYAYYIDIHYLCMMFMYDFMYLIFYILSQR